MRTAVLILLLLSLSACGASLRDPLAVKAYMARCDQAAAEGKADFAMPPFLPVLGCRI